VLLHRVKEIRHEDNTYTIIAEPMGKGFQSIMFRRMNPSVVLRFVMPDGTELERWDESAPPDRVINTVPPGTRIIGANGGSFGSSEPPAVTSAVGRMGNLGKILRRPPCMCFLSCSRTHYLLLLFSIFILPILPKPPKAQCSSQLDGQDVGHLASGRSPAARHFGGVRRKTDSSLFKIGGHVRPFA